MLTDDLKGIAGLGIQHVGGAAVDHCQAQIAGTVDDGNQLAFFGFTITADETVNGVVIQPDVERRKGQQVVGPDFPQSTKGHG